MQKNHRWTIDSIEESFARVDVDGRETMHVPQWMLPRGAREGDVLAVQHEVSAERSVLQIDRDELATGVSREESIRQLRGAPKSGKGDIRL